MTMLAAACDTVTEADPEAVPPVTLAVMLAEPSATAVTNPLEVTVATAAFEVVHSREAEDEAVPTSWTVSPTLARVAAAGLTVTVTTETGVSPPSPPPHELSVKVTARVARKRRELIIAEAFLGVDSGVGYSAVGSENQFEIELAKPVLQVVSAFMIITSFDQLWSPAFARAVAT
jgi:hypothetical protein